MFHFRHWNIILSNFKILNIKSFEWFCCSGCVQQEGGVLSLWFNPRGDHDWQKVCWCLCSCPLNIWSETHETKTMRQIQWQWQSWRRPWSTKGLLMLSCTEHRIRTFASNRAFSFDREFSRARRGGGGGGWNPHLVPRGNKTLGCNSFAFMSQAHQTYWKI